MIPRIYTDTEARALRHAATPGPWQHNWRGPEDGPHGDLWHTLGPGGPLANAGSFALAAAAPDLAATVEVLHGQIEEMRTVIATLEALRKEDVEEARAMEKIKAGTLLRAFAHKMLTEGNHIERLLPLVICAEKIERGDEAVDP